MPVVMGVDSSTQSTKVEVRDADTGELLDEGRADHEPTRPPRSEQDPASWWSALLAARHAAGTPPVHAMSVAAQQHALVVLDAAGAVIRPAKLWNDTESAPDAGWLIGKLGGPEAWAEACGTVPVAALTITKLSWLHRVEPDHFTRVARVVLPHDWLTALLSGRFATDRGDASGTGYWSPSDEEWRLDLLEIVDAKHDWQACLPEVLEPDEPNGEIDGLLVAPGTGDNMAAALGVGLRPGDVAISLGTSGTVFTVSDEPTADASGAVAGFADATGRYLPLVCTLNATKVTDAVARLLSVEPAELDELALAARPGADGVVLVPYFDGERTPDRPDASGVLAGLRSGVTPEQVARAAFEGVVCGLLDGLDALAAQGLPVDGRLVLVGGGSRSLAYRQVLADLTGRTVEVAAGERVAIGACVQAASLLTGTSTDEIAAGWGLSEGETVEPTPDVDIEAVRSAYRAVAEVDLEAQAPPATAGGTKSEHPDSSG